MPQLDFHNPLTIAQVVWMALLFGALYVMLANWALPQVASVLEHRSTRIAGDIESARLAKDAADTAVAELTQASRRAATESQAAIARSVAEAKAQAAESARIANERLDEQLREAEQRIAASRRAAMSALRGVATDAANSVVARLTGEPAPAGLLEGAVTSAMAGQG